jgi:hypothetical protein
MRLGQAFQAGFTGHGLGSFKSAFRLARDDNDSAEPSSQ